MVRGSLRSRTLRRVFRRTPGSRTVLQYKKRKPSKAKCSACGRILHGVPRERPTKMQNIPKTHKRPERPFGGELCSRCMRLSIIDKARSEQSE